MLEGALSIVGDRTTQKSSFENAFNLPRLGDYQLLEEIARGGMGVVYKARQISLNRIVAVKLILSGQFADTAAIRRFRAEASAAAKLRHPNIVAIYEIGEEAGQHFFSMEHVDGPTLGDFVRQRPTSIRQAVGLVQTIAEAVHYAHEHGIIHRDLKPSNILIDCFHAPHITDFGLARDLLADSELTVTGQVLGSPNYISPEQASGKAVGPASDIYALGAILYHLLSGRPPFAGETVTETLQQVAANEPVSPRLLNPSVPRDLETICLKCLEKDPAQRYSNAEAVAAELSRFLKDEPILARPISPPAKAWRWCRRKPVVAGLGSAFVTALTLGFAVSAWQASARKSALAETRRTLYIAQMHAVQDAWTRGDIKRARSLLRAQIPKPGEEDLRGFEWRHFGKLCRDGSAITITNEFEKPMVAVELSPDGSLLATADENGRVTLRRTGEWKIVNDSIRHAAQARVVRFTPDGRSLLTAGSRTVQIWEVATGRERAVFNLTNRNGGFIVSACLSPDGTFIAIENQGRLLRVWDINTAEIITTYERPGGDVRTLEFSPDGSTMLFSNGDSTIHVWDVRARKFVRSVSTRHLVVGALKYSPDGRLLASSGSDGLIQLWSTGDWSEEGTLSGHGNTVTVMSFSPNGRILVSGCVDSTLKAWDIASQSELQTFYGHALRVEDVAFFPDGRRIASIADETLKIWDLPEPVEGPSFEQDPVISGWAGYARFSPDGRVLVTMGADDSTERRVWDSETGRMIARLTNVRSGHEAAVVGEFSPDARFFTALGQTNSVLVWDTEKWELVAELITENPMHAVAFSDKGELFASSSAEEIIRRWSERCFDPRPPLPGYEGGVTGLRFSPDGAILAAWCLDGNVRLLDTRSETFLQVIYHSQDYPDMVFSPDSKLLAVTSSYATGLWDVYTGELIVVLEGKGAVFSPDGKMLALSTAGPSIHLWDLQKRRVSGRLSWQGGWSASMAFSPDGRTLVSSDSYVTLRIWSMRMMREVITLSPKAGARTFFSPDGNTLAVLNHWRENKLLKALSFAEVERDLEAEVRGEAGAVSELEAYE